MGNAAGGRQAPVKAKQKKLLLVVDSNHRDATCTAVLLQNFGYNSAVVRTAEEALEFFSIATPALVVTELVLPGKMNGIDLYEHVKGDPSKPTVPVIVHTKIASVEVEDYCRRSGCSALVNKPVQIQELFRAVQQALEPTPRENIRIPVLLPVTVNDAAGSTEHLSMLSDSGCFIRTHHPLAPGSRNTVTFLLQDHVIRTDAVVLYVSDYSRQPGKEPGMGMKFLNLSPLDKDLIQRYIHDHVAPAISPLDQP